jgi:hypothetical protein
MRRISGKAVRKSGAKALAAPSHRLFLTLFCLLAFSFQSYISQTHIHVPGTTDLGISAGFSVKSPVSADAKAPAIKLSKNKRIPANGNDASNCPLCQAVLHAGFFLTPALLVLLLPDTQNAVGPAFIVSAYHEGAPSHAWHSRGPPQL